MNRSKQPVCAFAFAFALAAAAALAISGMSTAAVATPRAACPDFVGPAWTFPATGKSGTKWKVTATGITCALATTWAKKLIHTPYKGEAATTLHGPTGYHCLPSIPAGKGVPGECAAGSKSFSWEAHA